MGYAVAGTTARSIITYSHCSILHHSTRRAFHASTRKANPILEPRLEDHGRVIRDKYSVIREDYGPYPNFNSQNLACADFYLQPLQNTQSFLLMAFSVLMSCALLGDSYLESSTGVESGKRWRSRGRKSLLLRYPRQVRSRSALRN